MCFLCAAELANVPYKMEHAHDTDMFDTYKAEMAKEISEMHDVITNTLGI
jgi:hypothetical protein